MMMRCLVFLISNLLLAGVAFSAPNIWYTDITSGPTTGGENDQGIYLTITGTGFGTPSNGLPPATTHVTIGGVEVAVYKGLSQGRGRPDSWQLSVQVGGVSSGNIVVTTADGTATAPESFTVDAGKDIYFVSSSGSDSAACSYAAPCRSVSHALALCDPGDTVVVRGGDYNLSSAASANGVQSTSWIALSPGYALKTGSTGGTAGHPMTVMGYPGENPIGHWEGSSTVNGVETFPGERMYYFNFINLSFDLSTHGSLAFFINAMGAIDTSGIDHGRLINLTISGGMGSTCDDNGGYNTLILQAIPDTKMYGIDVGDNDPNTQEICGSHVLYQSMSYSNADFGWGYVHDNVGGRGAYQLGGDGMQARSNTNVRIHHSLFKNLPEAAILTGYGTSEIIIYDNVINDVCQVGAAGFSALALRGANTNGGEYYLYNNTIYTDAVDGYPGGIIQMAYSDGSMPEHITLKNNIVYAKTNTTNYYQISYVSWDPETRLTASNNLWYGSTESTPTWDTDPQSANPLFTTLGSDFTLQSSSPAIGEGVDLSSLFTTDYANIARGTTFDIGAYEYAEDEVPPVSATGHIRTSTGVPIRAYGGGHIGVTQ